MESVSVNLPVGVRVYVERRVVGRESSFMEEDDGHDSLQEGEWENVSEMKMEILEYRRSIGYPCSGSCDRTVAPAWKDKCGRWMVCDWWTEERIDLHCAIANVEDRLGHEVTVLGSCQRHGEGWETRCIIRLEACRLTKLDGHRVAQWYLDVQRGVAMFHRGNLVISPACLEFWRDEPPKSIAWFRTNDGSLVGEVDVLADLSSFREQFLASDGTQSVLSEVDQ